MGDLMAVVLRTTPLWLIGIILIGMSVGVCQLTLKATEKLNRRHGYSSQGSASAMVVTPVFALLAFMLATTFSMGLSRYDDRRSAVVAEAEAISTESQRAELLDEPYASILRMQIRAFAHCRVRPEGIAADALARRAAQCRRIGDAVWATTRTAVQATRTTALGS